MLKQRVPQARQDGCPPDAPIVIGGKVWGSQMLRGVDGVNGLSAGVSGFLRDADVRSEQSVAPTKRRRRRARARAALSHVVRGELSSTHENAVRLGVSDDDSPTSVLLLRLRRRARRTPTRARARAGDDA